MSPVQNPWDEDYQRRGRLWGGGASFIPSLFPSSRILELGCGNGKTVSSLVQACCSVTAIDSSSHAATLCRHTCTDPDQATILVADCRTTPFRDESFDVIIASHITSHLLLAGRSQLAGEVFRLLRHRGRMYFRDFSTGDFRYGRGEETEPGTFMRNNGILTHYFKDDEVPALFSGLTITSIKYQRWEMRIRGTVFPRAEIVAELQKPD